MAADDLSTSGSVECEIRLDKIRKVKDEEKVILKSFNPYPAFKEKSRGKWDPEVEIYKNQGNTWVRRLVINLIRRLSSLYCGNESSSGC